MTNFVDRILSEADLWSGDSTSPARQADHRHLTIEPRTIFFGGGTPSLLPAPAMQRLIQGLQKRFDCSRCIEWTIECNPATVSLDYCAMMRELGVNRLSFGAQSFHQPELAALERHHDPDDVPRSLEMARRAGFERLNIDLIYAIPGQSLESWADNLQRAIALNTEHLSCYGLTYEPNTPIAVKKRLGRITAVQETIELAMLHHTRRYLSAAGLNAYEVSNYARTGKVCQHNIAYWHGDDYIALGPSGASHVQGRRWKNRGHLGGWERAIDNRTLPVDQYEHLSPSARAGELAMLLLRLEEGLSFSLFQQRTGLDARAIYASQIDALTQAGLLNCTDQHLSFTETGLNVIDAIAAEFILDSE